MKNNYKAYLFEKLLETFQIEKDYSLLVNESRTQIHILYKTFPSVRLLILYLWY